MMNKIVSLMISLALILLFTGFAIAEGKEIIFSEYRFYSTMTDSNEGLQFPIIAGPVSILIGLVFLFVTRKKEKHQGGGDNGV